MIRKNFIKEKQKDRKDRPAITILKRLKTGTIN